MKRFTLFIIAALIATFAWSQSSLERKASPLPFKVEKVGAKLNGTRLAKQLKVRAPRAKAGAPKKAATAEGIAGDYTWDYQTTSDDMNTDVSSVTATAGSSHVVISASETTEGGVTISGMFSNALEATIESDDDVDYLVVTADQTAGTSSYGDYTVKGCFYYEGDDQYEAGWYYTDIVGEINDDGTVSFDSDTWLTRVLTTGSYAGYTLNPSWLPGSTFTPTEPLTVVTPPAGIEAAPYVMTYEEGNKGVNVIVDDDEVYFQGLSEYLPEAWVKGTKDGNTVTFPAMQYMGNNEDGDSYMFYEGDAVFTYDEEAGTYSATGLIYGVMADQWYDGKYTDPVLTPVVEKAATPANPSITSMEKGNYGWYVDFNVPLQDAEGAPMLADKVSYIFYTDVEGEVAPLTFTPETHTLLTEDMTEIPFGFTEGYDFYSNRIYLNELYSSSWNRLGIKSIYKGGDETNETEIQWFEIKPYGETVATFDFNAMDIVTSDNSSSAGDITETQYMVSGNVTLTISPQEDGASTPNRFWKTTKGPQLRVYSGTLTFSVPEYYNISKIAFGAARWNSGNSADSGEFDGSTWTGNAQNVVVSIAGNTQINVIDVTVNAEELTDELVELPEGVTPEDWTIEGVYNSSSGGSNEQSATQVAFDGTDIYVKGLAYYFEDSWIKGSIDSETGIAKFRSGQFVGEDEYGPEYLLGVDADGETFVNIEFAYDPDAQTLTQQTPYIAESGSRTLDDMYGYWTDVYYYAGEPVVVDPITLPEGVETETYSFKAYEMVENEEEEDDSYARKRIVLKDENEPEYAYEPYSYQVKVGFDGNDVYISGVSDNTANFWMKGTMSEDGKTVTIPANQYLGTLTAYIYKFDYFITSVAPDGSLADIVLNWDAENKTFSTDQWVILNDNKFRLGDPYQVFTDVEITKLEEFAATPADPAITNMKLTGTNYPKLNLSVPTVDIEDNDILTSKLFYTIWVDNGEEVSQLVITADEYEYVEEDMTEIPYTYDDSWDIYAGGESFYLNQGSDVIESWQRIGVQSIYYGGGERNESNIVWYESPVYTGITDVTANAGKKATVFDLQGRRVAQPSKGLFIMNGKKVLVK